MGSHRPDVTPEAVVEAFQAGASPKQIARDLQCGLWVVYDRLDAAGVHRPSLPRADLPVDEVRALYVDRRWSALAIARAFGVSPHAVRSVLRDSGVVLRSKFESRVPVECHPCPVLAELRAYVFGFVAGDLAVRQISTNSELIHLSGSTTREEQRELVRDVFGSFGRVHFSGESMTLTLDRSFSFLLQKYDRVIPDWIATPTAEAAMAAGYIDAEGSFGVYDGRARFKVDSYDEHIVNWMFGWCGSIGVRARIAQMATAGTTPWGQQLNGDLWRVTVNEAPSLLRLIATIEPFLRHPSRIDAAERARSNLLERLSRRVRPRPNSQLRDHRPR